MYCKAHSCIRCRHSHTHTLTTSGWLWNSQAKPIVLTMMQKVMKFSKFSVAIMALRLKVVHKRS